MRSLLGLLFVAALAQAQDAPPLNLKRSAKLSGTYTLSGRKTLAKGVRLTLQKGTKIIGQGERGALIRVEGSLEASGVLGEEVVLENIWLELDGAFKRVKLAHTRFSGLGGFFTPHEHQTIGKLSIEDVSFRGKASLWVTFQEGSLFIRRVSSESSCQIAGTHTDRNLKLDIAECFSAKDPISGFHGGLRLHNVKDVRILSTRTGGMITSFRGCTKLLLEACQFESRGFLMRQDKKARYGKTKILRCNFTTETMKFHAPRGSWDRVILDQCFFRGDAKTAASDIAIRRTEGTHVKVTVKAPVDKPHDLAAAVKKR